MCIEQLRAHLDLLKHIVDDMSRTARRVCADLGCEESTVKMLVREEQRVRNTLSMLEKGVSGLVGYMCRCAPIDSIALSGLFTAIDNLLVETAYEVQRYAEKLASTLGRSIVEQYLGASIECYARLPWLIVRIARVACAVEEVERRCRAECEGKKSG